MRLLTVPEGATILRVKPPRAYDLIREGFFPVGVIVKIGKRQLRFSEEGLRSWIESGGAMGSDGDNSVGESEVRDAA